MSLDLADARVAATLRRIAPYARTLLERAGTHALRLHADSVSPDHVLSTLMDDPDCAACAAVLHAFADPATISGEALAISPGVMVVGSSSTLPFSTHGLAALLRTRERAAREGRSEVSERQLFLEALAALPPRLVQSLVAAGLKASGLEAAAGGSDGPAVALDGPLFKHFSMGAKRCLSAANHIAAGFTLTSISPAHLALACLQVDEQLAADANLRFPRARLVMAAQTADDTPPTPRILGPDAGMVAYLGSLPDGADSLALLEHCLTHASPELSQILTRHKVRPELLARSRGVFRDPALPEDRTETGTSA
jgi:hypothetical protein